VRLNDRGIYALVLLVSALLLFAGNRFFSEGRGGANDFEMPYYPARITRILNIREMPARWGEGMNLYVYFEARITRGERRGDIVTATQYISEMFLVNERQVSPRDRIFVVFNEWDESYDFGAYARLNYIIILGIVFLALVFIFGRKKGFNAIVALGFTFMAVFAVFVPAILAGRSIHFMTILVCVFVIVSTLLIVIGANKKALAAMLGCFGGVFAAGVLMMIMDVALRLTGALDTETEMLVLLPNAIDLRALIFAGVILGAVGAIMDVAMSISSSLWELREAGGVSDFKSIVRSGINIGKDILGTMLNTLILAYIGASLSLILMITAHTTSFTALFNMEMIIVELLRALVGSFGMLLTIPLTASICGWLYTEAANDDDADEYFRRMAERRRMRDENS
jgi:uncharacterized membrane protein